jgi:hypothetical protein
MKQFWLVTPVIFASALVLSGCVPESGTSASAAGPAQMIPFRENVTVQVGQSVVVHGLRGECGALPTPARVAEATASLNAQTSLGAFSFGAEGVRRSAACNGPTPARQTIFTATAVGQETIRVHGDTVRITVR